ncbi:DNA repair protein XRCC4-like isoform X2 [Orbicella faveolata]|uniref:DNA repair protein XRCC4-like isoform X2 n=1 Tax=Orbicella faveolata TaxID=48498 RepID=UPI0009E4E0EC|nr:DNA repair protein XRCC4-like isoform X2 [Orbicella faveolata]
MQKYFSRIEVGGVKYYLLTELYNKGKNGFDLTVCNGEDVWRESVDSLTIESMAKTADMSVSEFADETGRALTGQTVGQDNFVYQAKLKGSNLQFSWKKHVGDGVKFQLGSLSLSKVCNDSVLVISSIFDLAVDQMTQLKQEMSSLRSDNARLSSERKDALKLLDKCVTAKEEMEKDLFEKFAAVLNDKKSKIRQLKELGNKIADSPNQSNSHDQRKGKSKGKANRHEDSEDDTDIEKMELEDSPVADSMKGSEQKPASSCFSPSLLPEENERFEPTVKRRRRRDPKPKESPAAKLVLPKVPSVKKTPSSSSGESSTSSRSRLRQRDSEKSLPDADDLMAEMEL